MEIQINPEVVKWARTRAGFSVEYLKGKFPRYPDWESGAGKITLPQLRKLAKATYLSEGALLLNRPLKEDFMMEEFRTVKSQAISKPSVHLLDVLALCRKRQDWYREYVTDGGYKELPFVGSASPESDPAAVAGKIREAINFDLEDRGKPLSEADYLKNLIDKVENAGIMVMVSSIVGSSNLRKLDTGEFRGFAISDKFAPLIFINGADYTPAQIFTLCHELAHIWLGKSGFVDKSISDRPTGGLETICNKIAAEILVPASDLEHTAITGDNIEKILRDLKKRYKVSNMVLLRRLKDINAISADQFNDLYAIEVSRFRSKKAADEGNKKGGGNFYRSLIKRSSRKFTWSLVSDTLYGGTLYYDAADLLDVMKADAIKGLAVEMGMR